MTLDRRADLLTRAFVEKVLALFYKGLSRADAMLNLFDAGLDLDTAQRILK